MIIKTKTKTYRWNPEILLKNIGILLLIALFVGMYLLVSTMEFRGL